MVKYVLVFVSMLCNIGHIIKMFMKVQKFPVQPSVVYYQLSHQRMLWNGIKLLIRLVTLFCLSLMCLVSRAPSYRKTCERETQNNVTTFDQKFGPVHNILHC